MTMPRSLPIAGSPRLVLQDEFEFAVLTALSDSRVIRSRANGVRAIARRGHRVLLFSRCLGGLFASWDRAVFVGVAPASFCELLDDVGDEFVRIRDPLRLQRGGRRRCDMFR